MTPIPEDIPEGGRWLLLVGGGKGKVLVAFPVEGRVVTVGIIPSESLVRIRPGP